MAIGMRVFDGWQGRWDDTQVVDDWFLCPDEKKIVMETFDSAASRAGVWRVSAIWAPSATWIQAGPLLDQFKLDIISPRPCWQQWKASIPTWSGPAGGLSPTHEQYGSTALEAACRCIVASKLGEAVEVPEVLAPGWR